MYQQELTRAGYGEITTEIAEAGPFYYAEDYHQQYLAKNPNGYCGLGGTGVACPVGLAVAERSSRTPGAAGETGGAVETVTVRAAAGASSSASSSARACCSSGSASFRSLAGWVALLLGVVGLVAGLAGIVPGAAYVRFSPDGLTVKYAFLPGTHRAVARHRRRDERARAADPPQAAVARAHLRARIHRVQLGQHLDGERSYVANFTVDVGRRARGEGERVPRALRRASTPTSGWRGRRRSRRRRSRSSRP